MDKQTLEDAVLLLQKKEDDFEKAILQLQKREDDLNRKVKSMRKLMKKLTAERMAESEDPEGAEEVNRRTLSRDDGKPSAATLGTEADDTNDDDNSSGNDFPAFKESTHIWVAPGKKYDPDATLVARIIGAIIILFQLQAYSFIISDIFEEFEDDYVPVFVKYSVCSSVTEDDFDGSFSNDLLPDLACKAEVHTPFSGVITSGILVSLFLLADVQDGVNAFSLTYGAYKESRDRDSLWSWVFACLALIEVATTYFTCITAASQRLYVGDTSDALEVGVGLLFIHDLGGRVYVALAGKTRNRKYLRAVAILGFLLVTFSIIWIYVIQRLF